MKNLIFLTVLLFLSAACGSKSSDSDPSTESSDSTEVIDDSGAGVEPSEVESASSEPTDECDRFISEYESWTNRYINAMRQYKQNPTDMSLVQKFTDMANEASQWNQNMPSCSEPEHLTRLNNIAQRLMDAANMMAQ